VAPDDPRAFAAEIARLGLDARARLFLGAAARTFAVTRDSAAEDAALLSQYAAAARAPGPAPAPRHTRPPAHGSPRCRAA